MQKILLGSIAQDTQTYTIVINQDSRAKRPWTQEKHHHPGTPGGKANDARSSGAPTTLEMHAAMRRHTSDRGGGLWEVLTLHYQEAAQLRERQNLCCGTTYWKTKESPLMAPHSSVLAWKIPWTEEPDGLQSIGSQRVGHD